MSKKRTRLEKSRKNTVKTILLFRLNTAAVKANRAGWTAKSSGFWFNDDAYSHARVLDGVKGNALRVYHTPHDGTVDATPQHYHWIQVNFGSILEVRDLVTA